MVRRVEERLACGPDGMTAESYLQAIAEDGLKKRIEEAYRRQGNGAKIDGDVYAARLAHELGVIQKMQFAGYFLIVWDFIRYAKEHRIPVGPGRGSGDRNGGRPGGPASWTSAQDK